MKVPAGPIHWPQSIRGQLTIIAVVVATLLFVPACLASAVLARNVLAGSTWRHLRSTAATTATAVRQGAVAGTTAGTGAGAEAGSVVPHVPKTDLVQVVAPGRRVIAASPAARGRPPIATAWPTAVRPWMNVRVCGRGQGGCLRISAERVWPAAGSPVVYAGRRAPSGLTVGTFDTLFALQALALIGLAGWGTWKITDRVLRPVQAISGALGRINVNHLTDRVPDPGTRNEVAQLARTVNATLGRLEHAVQRQRQFTADASHELRTPLAGLRVQLEEARLHPEDTDLAPLLDRTLSDLDRIQSIIADMLLLARVEAGTAQTAEPLDLTELARRHLSGRPGEPVESSLEPAVMINASPELVDRVLGNLLDNAHRHAHHQVRLKVSHDSGSAELRVCDDGDGIPSADRDRVFQRFARLDSARSRHHGGTGLGLAIARDIAHAHQGTLTVEDSPLGGACLVLRLPLGPLPDGRRP
ncbi:sensor histidine kinase [Actinomadura rugatobispora]|uniref:histidine kinase n=1 Tax=Actinomadura rugatobispora TaxID=1994 RepID=A0ABW1AEJ6_9ACTN|nr:hypothetical protein GCM10010200_033350 [Actinomadura rugatobispora]